MRLGVEIDGVGPIQSGVARYLWNMLACVTSAAPDVELLIYARHERGIPLPPGNWRFVVDKERPLMPYPVWLQDRYPRLLARDRVDMLWGQNEMLPLKLAHRCLRIQTVHDLTALLFPRTMSKIGRVTSRLFLRRAVAAADHILADSYATSRLLRECLGVTEHKIEVVYPGCDAHFLPVSSEVAKAVVADKFGFAQDYLLSVGNMEPRKGHLALLAALELVPQAPVLLVVGNLAWQSQPICRAIRRAEQAGRARLLGRVEDRDLAVLYSGAKLMIYPSFYEGFGLPVLEAMACGCPVLCRWSSSLPEVGGQAADYFKGAAPTDLASKLLALLADSSRLAAMKEAGPARSLCFSYRRAAEQVLDVIRRLRRRRCRTLATGAVH